MLSYPCSLLQCHGDELLVWEDRKEQVACSRAPGVCVCACMCGPVCLCAWVPGVRVEF